MRGEVVLGKRSRDELRHTAAVSPTLRSRNEPAHDLPEIPGVRRARGRNRLRDEGLDRGVIELFGKVVGEDRDLRLLLRREILAAALAERLDGFAAGLHFAPDDRLDLGVGQLTLLRLLGGVD